MAYTFNRLASIFDPRRFAQMGQQGGFAPPPDISQYEILPPPPEEPPPIMYPSPTGEAYGNYDPFAKPPAPKSPQSKPTALTGIPPIKPIKSVPNLYPERIDTPTGDAGPMDQEPVPGLRRGWDQPVSGRSPGTITNENMNEVPPYPEGYNRPSLDMGGYKNQITDISSRAQANAPNTFKGEESELTSKNLTDEEMINSLISKYKPDTRMSDLMYDMLTNMPQRDQDMSKWRKFGSFLVGFGQGPEAQEKATYAPYYRKLADWKARMDPTLKGAEVERQANVNMRQLVGQEAANLVARQRADAATMNAETARQRAEDQARIAENRLEIDRIRARGGTPYPNIETGTVFTLYKDGSSVDTGIPIKDATPSQQHQWELDKIAAKEAGDVSGRFKQFQQFPPGGGPPIIMEKDMVTGQSWPEGQRPAHLRNLGQAPVQTSQQAPTQQAPTQGPLAFGPGGKPYGQPPDVQVTGGMGTGATSDVEEKEEAPEQSEVFYGRPRSASQNEDDQRARARELISRDSRWKNIIKFDRGVPYFKKIPYFSGITEEEKKAAVDFVFGTLEQGQGFRPSRSQTRPQGGQSGRTRSGTPYQILD